MGVWVAAANVGVLIGSGSRVLQVALRRTPVGEGVSVGVHVM